MFDNDMGIIISAQPNTGCHWELFAMIIKLLKFWQLNDIMFCIIMSIDIIYLFFFSCRIVMGGIMSNPSLTFKDGVRSVDFVLVWEANKDDAVTPEAYERRRIFEQNLETEGLQLEMEAPEDLYGLHFVKVFYVLCVYDILCNDVFF